MYEINIRVDAFPTKPDSIPTQSESFKTAEIPSSDWTVELRGSKTGYLATKLEGWVARKLLGNVNKGER